MATSKKTAEKIAREFFRAKLERKIEEYQDILRVLDQTKIWIDASRKTHKLEKMEPDFQSNVLDFLKRKSEVLLGVAKTSVMLRSIMDEGVEPDLLVRFEKEWPQGTGRKWINQTPLVLKLEELLVAEEKTL
jgi:hypothetical protein